MDVVDITCIVVGVAVVAVLTTIDGVAQRRRKSRWVAERMKEAGAENGEESDTPEETCDLAREIVADELGLPPDLIRATDTLAELGDLGMEISDLRPAIRKRLGLHFRDRDFFHSPPCHQPADGKDVSLTILDLEWLISRAVGEIVSLHGPRRWKVAYHRAHRGHRERCSRIRNKIL